MALEPAGVSLEAKGFREYLRKLDQIDKKNRDVFDTKFSGTEKSFNDVQRAAKKYQQELNRLAAAERKAAQEAKKLAAAEKTAAATRATALINTAQATIQLISNTGKAAFEIAKLGAQFEGQQQGLSNLAASFGQSGSEIQNAIVRASAGTVSGLQAIQAANQGLLLGVAKTPEEFAKLTNAALTLGRTLGLTSEQSLEQFTTALGRQSTLILDNFGISAKQVNAEIEKLAQAKFGKARSELSEAQKSAAFMEAALKLAGEAAEVIGDNSDSAAAAFARLEASSENFKTELGIALSELNSSLGISATITREVNQATDAIKVLRGSFAGADIDTQIEATELRIRNLEKTIADTTAEIEGTSNRLDLTKLLGLDKLLGGLDESALESQKAALSDLNTELERLKSEQAAEEIKTTTKALEDQGEVIGDNVEQIKAFRSVLSQAQSLQLQLARESEDTALKRSREIEDIARRTTRQVSKLDAKQAKDRDKLLQRQQKRLEDFDKNREKQIKASQKAIADERRKAREDRIKAQQELQNRLAQQRARFNLSQLQSERRFQLAETRLRAAGDILGLQQLREDRELQLQEEKENFDLTQKETTKSGQDRIKEESKQAEDRLRDLQANLEQERVELLQSFDEQFEDLKQSQIEARIALQQSFNEQAEDRKIALQREEEDRRISQQRQLEDLGRSWTEQEAITESGAAKVAAKLEEIFGLDGAADNIMKGYTERTKSDFEDLFDDIEKTLEGQRSASRSVSPVVLGDTVRAGGSTRRVGGIPEFDEGGVVQGPVGQPKVVLAHAGETILPTHKKAVAVSAPIIPAQTINVNMSGGFNVTGAEGASEGAKDAALEEMAETFELAVNRLLRRN